MHKPKLHIGMLTGGLEFDGGDIANKTLGGSETAFYYMAKELAKLGHHVQVFCNTDKPGEYEGPVGYQHVNDFKEFAGIVDYDVFIVSRHLDVLAKRNFKASQVAYWIHDMPAFDKNHFMTAMYRTDHCLVMSDYQKRIYTDYCGDLEKLLHVTRNGVDVDLIRSSIEGVKRKNNRFVYASRPERGLDFLLEQIWPVILNAMPDAELIVSSYDTGSLHDIPKEVRAIWNRCNDLVKASPNVRHMGSLGKSDYYKLLASCRAMLYPTNFPEISCINAMETLMCGTPLISTKDFALEETARKGAILLDEPWGSVEYVRKFVFETLDLAKDDTRHAELQSAGQTWIAGTYDWGGVAKDWESLFLDYFANRRDTNTASVLRNLVRNDDYVAAEKFIEEYKLPEDNESAKDVASMLTHAESPLEKDTYVEYDLRNDDNELMGRYQNILSGLKSFAKSLNRKKTKVLDVGCLHGQVSRGVAEALKEIGLDCEVLGVDFNDAVISRAKEITKQTNVDYKVFKFGHEDESELGKFDLVFCGEVIEHMVDTQNFLQRIKNVLRHDGYAVFTCPQGCWKPIVGPDHETNPHTRGHVHCFDMGDLNDIFGNQEDYNLLYHPAGVNYAGELVGNWIFSFQNSPAPFGEVDYQRKFLTTRPWPKLSVAMITRDNEDDLRRCLKSVHKIADELIIVDTGSQDKTVSIAKEFTDKVFEIEWPEDFSVARNISVDHCTGDWVLWLDSDEVLVNPERVRKYTHSRLFRGYVIKQNHLMLDFQAQPDVPVRLLRNDQGFRFYGVIHEHCEEKMDVPIHPAMILGDVDIAHYGYLNEAQRRSKCAKRNLALLAKDLRINPKRKLTKVLLMRDYINLANWDIEREKAITPKAVEWLRTCVLTFKTSIDPEHKTFELAKPLYQQALELLGKFRVPVSDDISYPPFEGALTLAVSHGGLSFPPGQSVEPDRLWFGTVEEHQEYLKDKREEIANVLNADPMVQRHARTKA